MIKIQKTLPRLFPVVFFFALALAFTPGNAVYAEEESTYSHISFVDSEATVIREDQTEHKAVVNLPVAPGDQVATDDKNRCELQFDNGTVIRLDKNTRLEVTSVLAPSLTSRWKITTLRLLDGRIYTLVQSYNREMFQVITANAAFDLKRRSTAVIQVKDNGDTVISADKGKFKALYGADADSLKTETISPGESYTITTDHQMRRNDDSPGIEFKSWNDYINRNYKDLHYGISKVPKKISRHPGLQYWAEKWSSLFGEWVYDELFGYVWRPYDEYFAYSARPFYHADFVKINGKLFLVPQQPWGWVPAHMGTWIWTKRGWTWIPGEAFSTGVGQFTFVTSFYAIPTFSCWMYRCYGDYDLYYIYRTYGMDAWRSAYQKTYHRAIKKPSFAGVPDPIRDIFKKMNKAPVKMIKEHLETDRQFPTIDVKNLKPTLIKRESPLNPDNHNPVSPVRVKTMDKTGASATTAIKPVTPGKDNTPVPVDPAHPVRPVNPVNSTRAARQEQLFDKGNIKADNPVMHFRDWNPDVRWGIQTGNNVQYSSKTNEMVCPDLKLNSRSISARERMIISSSSYHGGYVSGSGSSSSSSGSSGSASSPRTAPGTGFAENKGGGGNTHGSGNRDNK